MNAELFQQAPVPIWVATVLDKGTLWRQPWDELVEAMGWFPSCEFRGVSLDRVSAVLSTGIDVEPTSAPMLSTTNLGKAAEYGGMPIVILVLDKSCLEQSFRVLEANSADEELAATLETYPNAVHQEDRTIWCSRLDLDDPRAGTPYEFAYGRWIPGDAHEALRAILIVAEGTDRDDVIGQVARSAAVSSLSQPSMTAPSPRI